MHERQAALGSDRENHLLSHWFSWEGPLSACPCSCPSSCVVSAPSQVSQSKEHQQFITFLQRLLGPLLEAYSSAAMFIHNFSGSVPEPEYLQRLHKYLIMRTEKNVAAYGTHATRLASFKSLTPWITGMLIIAETNCKIILISHFIVPSLVRFLHAVACSCLFILLLCSRPLYEYLTHFIHSFYC